MKFNCTVRTPYVQLHAMKLPPEIQDFFRKHGASGGKKRARNLTPEERVGSARKAAQARWKKKAAKTSSKRGTK